MILKHDTLHQGLKLYKVYTNDDPGQIGSPITLNVENCYKVILWGKLAAKD